MQETLKNGISNIELSDIATDSNSDDENVEGLDENEGSLGDYPIDDLLIRHQSRTVSDVIRRIQQSNYVMDPDFQRDFLWNEDKQSKLIESVIMRIPLPVFYMAEDEESRMIVVDGLQRLTTFHRFITDKFKLKLPDRNELNGLQFSGLPTRIKNRIEDCNLIFYIIDSKVPERAKLDIFERVNGGVPLTNQQMRNSLFMGSSTRFLKKETRTQVFLDATCGSLNQKTMRDREFVNRYCAFKLLGLGEYRGDMDQFLADCLRTMNKMNDSQLFGISIEFQRGLSNNRLLFGLNAFRKYQPGQERRSVLNASLWDVMSTGLSCYDEARINSLAGPVRESIYQLLENEDFKVAITSGTNDSKKVKARFELGYRTLAEVLGDFPA
ncbi:MAG: DUF262 domain-containing protein [Gammaproteobacteria bacterium]|nr:DUF262 domain-containing protein [Gammaproteobacteria bacterium]